jgi:hypothetical protein
MDVMTDSDSEKLEVEEIKQEGDLADLEDIEKEEAEIDLDMIEDVPDDELAKLEEENLEDHDHIDEDLDLPA